MVAKMAAHGADLYNDEDQRRNGENGRQWQRMRANIETGEKKPLRAVASFSYSYIPLRFCALLVMLIAMIQSTCAQSNGSTPLLQCLQVAPPVASPATTCKQILMVHTFAWSYGMPFVGDYTPPECAFNRVTFNFTVTSAGRQFDRLGLMFLDDTDVFRTSTAEPTQTGIIWTYEKDMTQYLPLLQTPHKLIFDLGNLVDDTYTGVWNTTLTATYFTSAAPLSTADLILPLSAKQSALNQTSAFRVPDVQAIDSLTLPRNAQKAVFAVSACGQAAEEFWWSNVLTSDERVFGNDTVLYGHSAFREVQLLIDGTLAGVAWPFPVIFTGGVVPGFWRPVVGIDAFDLQDDEIDISPFIPILSDGQAHKFEIRVVGVDDDGHGNGELTVGVESNWVVTGKVFIWLDDGNNITTTGTAPQISAPPPSIHLSSSSQRLPNSTVSTLDYSIRVARSLTISSTLHTSQGPRTVTWTQNLSFTNTGTLSNGGNDQVVSQVTLGSYAAPHEPFSLSFAYPLTVTSSFSQIPGGNLSITAEMARAKNTQQFSALAVPNTVQTFDYSGLSDRESTSAVAQSNIANSQNGSAWYLSAPALKKSFGGGTTEQVYSLAALNGAGTSTTGTTPAQAAAARLQDAQNAHRRPHRRGAGAGGELYSRHIIASNNSVIFDVEHFGPQEQTTQVTPQTQQGRPRLWVQNPEALRIEEGNQFAVKGVRAVLGRGSAGAGKVRTGRTDLVRGGL